jgi:hypothetical protein
MDRLNRDCLEFFALFTTVVDSQDMFLSPLLLVTPLSTIRTVPASEMFEGVMALQSSRDKLAFPLEKSSTLLGSSR